MSRCMVFALNFSMASGLSLSTEITTTWLLRYPRAVVTFVESATATCWTGDMTGATGAERPARRRLALALRRRITDDFDMGESGRNRFAGSLAGRVAAIQPMVGRRNSVCPN